MNEFMDFFPTVQHSF